MNPSQKEITVIHFIFHFDVNNYFNLNNYNSIASNSSDWQQKSKTIWDKTVMQIFTFTSTYQPCNHRLWFIIHTHLCTEMNVKSMGSTLSQTCRAHIHIFDVKSSHSLAALIWLLFIQRLIGCAHLLYLPAVDTRYDCVTAATKTSIETLNLFWALNFLFSLTS